MDGSLPRGIKITKNPAVFLEGIIDSPHYRAGITVQLIIVIITALIVTKLLISTPN
jgi:hypothetical protein